MSKKGENKEGDQGSDGQVDETQSPRHELRKSLIEEIDFTKSPDSFETLETVSAEQKRQTNNAGGMVIENLLDQSKDSPASFFIHSSEVGDVEGEMYRNLYALASLTKNHRMTHFVVYGINREEMSHAAWKELRGVGVKTLSEDLARAYQLYGQKQSEKEELKYNVHFSTTAVRLKKQQEEGLLPFLSRGFDLPAALLFARSGGRMKGIQKKEGVYSVFDQALMEQLRAYQAQLVIEIAA